MNNDSISREYVEKIVIAEFVDLQDGTDEWRTYVNDTCESILSKVHNAPTVCGNNPKWCESCVSKGKCASTRVQGEWMAIEPYNHKTFCSFCKKDTRDMNYDNFCPNCGADMKGGAK